jgi:hypothetical protein
MRTLALGREAKVWSFGVQPRAADALAGSIGRVSLRDAGVFAFDPPVRGGDHVDFIQLDALVEVLCSS